MEVKIRSYDQILTEATNAEELKTLSDSWKEIVSNKYSYSLVQLRFAREYLEELARKMARRDSELLRQFFTNQ